MTCHSKPRRGEESQRFSKSFDFFEKIPIFAVSILKMIITKSIHNEKNITIALFIGFVFS